MQNELIESGKLLDASGCLTQVGWSRQPLLDCNLEKARFYRLQPMQRFRIKRWDYYAFFSPRRFFSATIADLGYAGNIFVYTLDLETGELHEEGSVIPLGKGIILPPNSTAGVSHYEDGRHRLHFEVTPAGWHVSVFWPGFHSGRGIQVEILLSRPPEHESMNITIPIGRRRFFFNRKINCLPAEGYILYGDKHEALDPANSLGSLDWGRGVWEYRSFWNWASLSGFLPSGDAVGLNLGLGFGDLSTATENALILNGRIHKLDQVRFIYDCPNFLRPWKFVDNAGRLDMDFTPIAEREACTNLGIIYSEVHQVFGRYTGQVIADDGQVIRIENLIGFAEEHNARW